MLHHFIKIWISITLLMTSNTRFKIHTIMYIPIYTPIFLWQIILIFPPPTKIFNNFTDLSVKFFIIILIYDSGSLIDIFTQLFESANTAKSINFASFFIKE